MKKINSILFVAILTIFVLPLTPFISLHAQVVIGDWPDLYDPFTLHSYKLTMTEANWDTIRYDLTYDIEVPALFSAEDESSILISVRRKSATAFPNETDPIKVSLKLDINEFTDEDEFGNEICDDDGGFINPTCVETWHGVKKLSLENGDDNNVVTEGFAWYLQDIAADSELEYTVGLFNWITLDITLIERAGGMPDITFSAGVYVNVEQLDKTYLKNHDLWEGGDDTWFYEYDDPYLPGYEEAPEDINGEPIDSPGFIALNYKPFQECKGRRNSCDNQPNDIDFVSELNRWINMESMLTYNAVAAFHGSPDDLFTKGKNFLHTDYSIDLSGEPIRKREYVQWDLDSAFNGFDVTADIYNQTSRKFGYFEDYIIKDSTFKGQYTVIMQYLMANVFIVEELQADLYEFENLLGDALAADPYNALPDSVADYFSTIRQFIADRHTNVLSQLPSP